VLKRGGKDGVLDGAGVEAEGAELRRHRRALEGVAVTPTVRSRRVYIHTRKV
jgi:hypothetical protein